MLDPFTQVSQRLIQIFRGAPSLTAPAGIGVKAANIIDLTDAIKAQSDPVAAVVGGTAPQIVVLPSRGEFRPWGRNSRTVEADRDFLIVVSTDTLRVGGQITGRQPLTLFAVQWAILLAFVGIDPELGMTGLVRCYTPIITAERGLLDEFPMLDNGTRRWTALLNVKVSMYWSSSELLRYIASLNPS